MNDHAITSSGPQPPQPLANAIAAEWALDPDIDFLNHGCFGARPTSVEAAQAELRSRFERQPIDFLEREREARIDAAKAALCPVLGMRPEDMGFVTNATGGVNAVLRSLSFNPGDDIATTNHVYNAVRMTMSYLANEFDGTYTEIDVPVPSESAESIVDAIAAGLTDRTRILVIDHVTSETALRFPVKAIAELCAARGIPLLVDGAHAPGMVPLDIASLGVPYYTGNLHKWISAPVGAAFLWVRPEEQAGIHPNTISHFRDQGLAQEFSWQGTRDITPWLCVESALAYWGRYGLDDVMAHNHALATWAHAHLVERWGVEPASPLDGSLLGSMATIRVPESLRRFENPDDLRDLLRDEHRIEVPIIDWGGRRWLRVSCQIYHRPEQFERLGDVIASLAGLGE